MPDEYTPTPDSYMDRVDKAGGFDAYKAQKEAADAINKIPKEKWQVIGKSVEVLETIADAGGLSEVLTSITSGIKEQLTLEFERLVAPIKNELFELINLLFEPFMPFLEDFVGDLSSYMGTSVDFWTALLTGKLDKFARDNIELANKLRADWWASGEGQRAAWNRWGIDLSELDESGTAGGTYSGQFDIDLEALENMFAGMGGGYTQANIFKLRKGIARKRKVVE